MDARRDPPPPLKPADLERLALRYVERYATTRAKLADYLARKLRERGWAGEGAADPRALAERMAELGYVDDRLYAQAKAGAMARRGLGGRRVRQALRFAGVEDADAEAIAPDTIGDGVASALAFARRRRFGPYAVAPADRPLREKQLAAMVRAGHAPGLARTILGMAPGDDAEALLQASQS